VNSLSVNVAQSVADRLAIGLSLLCSLHCLLVPVAVSLLPAFAAWGLDDESYHRWMLLGVIPASAFALTLGCIKHRNYGVIALGVIGVSILCLAVVLGHDLLGEAGERGLTVAGAVLVAFSHFKNYRLCDTARCSECSA